MSAEAAYVNFIKPVSAAFGAPPSPDVDAFFASLGGELAQFSDYQLGAGARQLVRERTVRTFPTVAECIAVCDRWPKVAPEVMPRERDEAEQVEPTGRRRDATFETMRGNYGLCRQASKDGWLGQLFDYVNERGCMPPEFDWLRLKTQAERVRDQLSAVGGGLGVGLIEAYRARYRMIQNAVLRDGAGIDHANKEGW